MSITIFDFDYTLFDTAIYVEELAKLMGFTVSEFRESYHKEFSEKSVHYNAYEHLKILGKEDRREELNEIIKNGNEYISPDARQVLKHFHQNSELILASKGNPEYQQERIQCCNISRFFNNIIVTKDKVDSLSFLKQATAHLIFINDNAEETLQLKKEFPNANFYLVESRYSYNAKHSFPVYHLSDFLNLTI